MIKMSMKVNDVPVLLVRDDLPEYRAVIILYHGYRATKEIYTERLEYLAKEGFIVVCPDNYYHGERKPGNYNEIYLKDCPNLFSNENQEFRYYLTLSIEKTAREITKIIDFIETLDLISINKIGILGESMGGMIAFRAAQLDKRVNVVATIASSPEYPVDDKNSPHCNLDKLYPAAIFATASALDEIMPLNKIKPYIDELKAIYGNDSNRIKYIEFADSKHFMNADDYNLSWETAKNWLKKWL